MGSIRFQHFSICLLLYLVGDSESQSLSISVNPQKIEIALTSNLNVSCNYHRSATEIGVASVIILRKLNNETTYTAVASINAFVNKPTRRLAFAGDVSGQISTKSGVESSLSVVFFTPGKEHAITYKCLVSTIDSHGSPHTTEKITVVTSEDPDIGTILNGLKDLQAQKRNCTKTMANSIDSIQDIEKIRDKFGEVVNMGIYNGHMYVLKYEDNNQRVTQLQQQCVNAGGYLVEINDLKEMNYLSTVLLPPLGNLQCTKIGLTNARHASTWTNMKNVNDPVYLKWYTQPSASTNYNYVELTFRNQQLYMQSTPNDFYNCHFICEVGLVR